MDVTRSRGIVEFPPEILNESRPAIIASTAARLYKRPPVIVDYSELNMNTLFLLPLPITVTIQPSAF